jgi:outer membrane protein assembly factor BamB
MEPPVSYPESDKYRGQQIYGKKSSGCAKFGCFGIIGGIILIVIIGVIGYFFVFPALTPNSLKGDFLDVTVVPGKEGSPKLWVLTDGSFNFIKETKSPGKHSVGRACYFCKLWVQVYDPVKEEVLNKIKIEQEDVITTSNILYRENEVWVAIMQYGENPPQVYVYDSQTGELKMNTKGFESKHPELSSGISELSVGDEDPVNIRFKTKDGRADQILDFASGKLYDGWAKYNDSKAGKDQTLNSIFVLNSRGSTVRKNLYLVEGTKEKVNKPSNFESTDLENLSSLKFSYNASAKKLVPDKGFIEGLFLYQDKDACIIIHQAVADKDSDRLITCVDASGKVRWEITQKDLFKKARVDKDDPFSSAFFMKSKFGAIVQSGIFVFKLEGSGVIGFDYNTGKKLWELEF